MTTTDKPAKPTATDLKDEGNTLFKQSKFHEAAAKYSQALALEETAVVYANRAQCFLSLKR